LIDPAHDSFDSLDTRIRSTATTLLKGMEVRFQGSLRDGAHSLSMSVRRNVFLIFKEVLHNIVRHAGAQTIDIELDASPGLRVVVRDDGQGFDPTTESGGYGFNSMRRRADEVGARIEIQSERGVGTTVTIDLDLVNINVNRSGLEPRSSGEQRDEQSG
jgi:signal transduction histidine kinase